MPAGIDHFVPPAVVPGPGPGPAVVPARAVGRVPVGEVLSIGAPPGGVTPGPGGDTPEARESRARVHPVELEPRDSSPSRYPRRQSHLP